jgi:hypothetical protein
VLALRLDEWRSMPSTAAATGEAAERIAHERRHRHARAAKKNSKPPTLERRAPAREQQRSPWASSGSAGGSAGGSATLRVFALAALTTAPFALPRGLRVAPRSSLVPAGVLGVSPPERPG